MNEASSWGDRGGTGTGPRRMVRSLRRRQPPPSGDDPSRLADAIEGVLDGTGSCSGLHLETAEALALLGRSSLGLGDGSTSDAETDTTEADDEVIPLVAEVLDRLAGPPGADRHHRGLAPSAAGAWDGAVQRLADRVRANDGTTAVAERSARRGLEPPERGLGTWTLQAGEAMARALIESLGGDWDRAGWRHLYRAARFEQRMDDGGGGEARTASASVSGLLAAVWSDRRSAGFRVQGPLPPLPWTLVRRRVTADLAERVGRADPSSTVLFGPPGSGKTTAARAVVDRARAVATAVYWFPAPDLRALVVGLEQVAVRSGAPATSVAAARHPDPAAHVERLWALVDRVASGWLIVLDAAGPTAVGHPGWIRRPRRGHVMVTTAYGPAQRWAPSRVVEIGELYPDDARRLLLSRFHDGGCRVEPADEEHAETIARLLSASPLALAGVGDLVVRSVNDEPGERSGSDGLEMWADRVTPGRGQDALDVLYDVGLAELGDDCEPGRRLLRLLACYAPDEPLPLRVLAGAPERRWVGEAGQVRDGLMELARVGLVAVQRSADAAPTVRIHLAIALRSRADPCLGDPGQVRQRALELLDAELRGLDGGRPEQWTAIAVVEPHVAEMVDLRDDAPSRAHVLELASRAARALMRTGQHESATTLLDRAMHLHGQSLDDADETLVAARTVRAWMTVLDQGGNLPRAEEQFTQLIADAERLFGPEHRTSLVARDTIAWVWAEQQGDLDRAERALADVLAVRTRQLGAGHHATLGTRHRLAWVRAKQGHVTEAVEEFSAVLPLRQAVLGRDHLDVFSTAYRLCWATSRLGRHDEARAGFDDLLERVSEVLGPSHPLVMMVRSRCAWARMWAGETAEAVRRYEELIPDQEKTLGQEHPRLLVNRHNLAGLQLQLGRAVHAEEELRSLVRTREAVLGPDHPFTLDSRELHAWALLRVGSAEDADRALCAVLADRRRALGVRHESTFFARYRLLRVVLHRGQVAEAEQLAHELLGDLDDAVGSVAPAHPTVPAVPQPGPIGPGTGIPLLRRGVRHALAMSCALQGRFAEARELLETVRDERLRDDPSANEAPELLTVRDHLAWLAVLGDRPDAVDRCEEVLAVRERVLGPDHPQTLTSAYRRAWALVRAGLKSDGLEAYDAVLARQVSLLGSDHPQTLKTRNKRLEALRRLGRASPTEAADVVAHQDRVQGPHAVDTLRARVELGRALALHGRRAEAVAVQSDVLAVRRVVLGPTHLDTRRSIDLVRGLAEPT